MDALYQMFSQLLDRKVEEIRGAYRNEQPIVQIERQNVDIPDDYIEIMRPSHFLSSPDLTIQSESGHPREIFHRQQSHPNVSSKITKL
uniref:Uncharacterized protein n=1 Tax=Panagrolaimus sp. ES5 TaxID=591445 RepID=A0AC34GKU8_9BILA